ncbi:hypothetical protein SteCoe_29553 [Stentor coeruleus]|uniref:Uncharacterized protein n=1 Tax=Stentor coeruleus TaxID=5963 RepID=A0A1R2B644_9CILI|nr:hypothetical protein SteCoe_29553 [Stentor coeruleus]
MALPQIQETDPWLEDDEENFHKYIEIYEKSQEKLRKESDLKHPSIAGTVTAIAKVSVYSYLIFKLISSSPIARIIITSFKHYAGKYHSLSSLVLILLITLLSHIKA